MTNGAVQMGVQLDLRHSSTKLLRCMNTVGAVHALKKSKDNGVLCLPAAKDGGAMPRSCAKVKRAIKLLNTAHLRDDLDSALQPTDAFFSTQK